MSFDFERSIKMEITPKMVKELREKTGAGIMDCKNALTETDGNIEKAVDLLREKGLSAVAKKADRIAAEGVVEAYSHNNRIAGVLEVNSDTDFVAKNEEIKHVVRDMVMQVAATKTKYVSRDELPEEEVEHEKKVLREHALNEGKPEHIVDKMVEGRVNRFFEEIVLVDQPF